MALPEITLEQITAWLRSAAEGAPSATPGLHPPTMVRALDASPPEFDFKRAKAALKRARAKSEVKAPQPFRRLRRNQAAVNEGLIDACNALISVNKQMATELAELSAEVANLRFRLTAREVESQRKTGGAPEQEEGR